LTGTTRNDSISGFPVGIRLSEQYAQSVIDSVFSNNHYDIEIPNAIARGRSISISNPTFTPSTDPTHLDVFWLQEFNAVFTRNIDALFVPDTVIYNGKQLFAPWQAADFVPFPEQPSGVPALPSILIGKTNQQLFALYGLAMGGALAPDPSAATLTTNGTVGDIAPGQPQVTLVSPRSTSQLKGYQLQYRVDSGPMVTYPHPVDLTLGWNAITITTNGAPSTLFVLGQPG
jgi:hypothetical protein